MGAAMKRKDLVGTITVKGKHRLSIEGLLEYSDKGYPADVVFLTIDVDMQATTLITMQLELNDLYDFIYAAKELLEIGSKLVSDQFDGKKSPRYKKYTKSAQFSSILFLGVKTAPIKKKKVLKGDAIEYEANYFVNIRRNEVTYSIGFNLYSLKSLVQRLTLLSEQLNHKLFAAQAVVAKKAEEARFASRTKGDVS
jgi:hypothetical protein